MRSENSLVMIRERTIPPEVRAKGYLRLARHFLKLPTERSHKR